MFQNVDFYERPTRAITITNFYHRHVNSFWFSEVFSLKICKSRIFEMVNMFPANQNGELVPL